MKEVLFVSLSIWIFLVNVVKIWPISKGDRYYQRLQRWYILANKNKWTEAKSVAKNLNEEDISDFISKNRDDELKRRLNELTLKSNKNPDDLMEMAIIYYRLGKKEEAYKSISSAHSLDPIREDISKIYFTFQTFRL